MKRVSWFIALIVMVTFVLAACGEKTQDDILEDLESKMSDISGYKAAATMTLQTGNEPQTYEVEVWHQEKDYYRVALKNAAKDQSQIILRNDDGVFVLTPALNKSFRFQSDWPINSSQVYLYGSLIQDVLMDPERTFTATEDAYVFQTNTNYQNKNLSTQEITFNKKDLAPLQVKVMNPDLEVLVQLDFTSFEENASFNEGDFDMERNMTGAQMNEQPTMAELEAEMAVHYPMYTPDGTSLDSSQTVETDRGESVVLQYTGEAPFTLIQEKSKVVPATTPMNVSDGEPVDLGFTIGVMTEESLMWSYNGVDFYLASSTLGTEEMVSIARSVYGTQEK
ncbi:outer membrane lipoprotein carrier protein LolA [Alkalihalophilus marmarensis]|uniref:Sporulation protein n=1 Tax=Alkalihalophilus marmarensis DSM 21297 TaxID=1188261 RepID=U6SNX8_9BACI|nr:outer membrane lipoprotein carrier protein LolA [Alkalihalophilus marmarensis]ERN52620.1 sporulation protein [Alkalihalophilus marmarensis DSM 21297]MCM3491659.1 outer membrane lipoprotein carrier protein LolA [Alkalihalophilus marmarensis]